MTLLLALVLEWLIGDPQSRWHPVALFGRWASSVESRLYRDSRYAGVLLWLLVVTPAVMLLYTGHTALGWPFDLLLIWTSIGWKSLLQHVAAVLDAASTDDARRAVSMIVSRDTACMGREDARRAALESLAENASDAVIAPLFWFLLLGPVGAAACRMINTLDAMWGYRNDRYRNFGFWAAKVDDVANWLPARITARLLLWSGRPAAWHEIRNQAITHASPNAGWPEVALAFAADVRLGGPVMRGGQVDKRPRYGPDQARGCDSDASADAVRVVQRALLAAAVVALGISYVF